jgi:hypothetical protein
MTRKVERYFWGVELGVVGLVAVLSGWTASSLFANAFMREGRVPTARGGGPWTVAGAGVAGPGVAGPAGLRESGSEVQRRNLFCSSCPESVKPQTEPQPPPKAAPRLNATQVEFVRRGQSGVLHLLSGDAAPSHLSHAKKTKSRGCPASIRPWDGYGVTQRFWTGSHTVDGSVWMSYSQTLSTQEGTDW